MRVAEGFRRIRGRRTALGLGLAVCALWGCSTSPGSEGESATSAQGEATTGAEGTQGATGGTETGAGGPDPMLEDEDFGCILDWPKVRRFRITNVLGGLEASLAVAENPQGGQYPVGTLIQLVPSEAMVKRAPGFAPEANDWEFFSLDVSASGATILERGSDGVQNAFGGNCFECHAKADAQWDFICEQGHGCDPLPLTPEQIEAVQNADPRCG